MRLFVAVDLPAEAKASLDSAAAPIRSLLPSARWVRPGIFHLTLAFLGEVAADVVPTLSQSLRERLAQEGGFRAHFGVLGAFPNTGAVRILWMGLEPSARFTRLAELVQDGLRSAGASFDDKPFRSHVTLARCDPPWPAQQRAGLAEAAHGLSERLSGSSFACEKVTLFSSALGSGGPTYRAEVEFPLQSA
jgi:2'-5' RNA ligase